MCVSESIPIVDGGGRRKGSFVPIGASDLIVLPSMALFPRKRHYCTDNLGILTSTQGGNGNKSRIEFAIEH